LNQLASAHTGAVIGVTDGIVRHISPVRMGRRIININVIVFGLVQSAKTETGFRRGGGETKSIGVCNNETLLTRKVWALGLRALLPKALDEPRSRFKADSMCIRLHQNSWHDCVAWRIQVTLRLLVIIQCVNVDAIE
jgi:hypothetical protein